ncbi:hypothetical protein CFP56_008286 [Quercus suber]|uniref:Uncharacterized protein n=1 Tax=Quercus suber TaxID=58331 RepID=A0AAW0L3G5_QUESU
MLLGSPNCNLDIFSTRLEKVTILPIANPSRLLGSLTFGGLCIPNHADRGRSSSSVLSTFVITASFDVQFVPETSANFLLEAESDGARIPLHSTEQDQELGPDTK